jgi:predicted O-methyltransferase YrrM
MATMTPWDSRDEMASEAETIQFLYGLTRLLKPKAVVETGCYMGDVSTAIARALKKNDMEGQGGILRTCDTDRKMCEYTVDLLQNLPGYVHNSIGVDHIRNAFADPVDLAYLDSSGDRLEEAKALKLSEHGIVVLHDSRRPVADEIQKATGWQRVFIPTPRGLTIFQCTHQSA